LETRLSPESRFGRGTAATVNSLFPKRPTCETLDARQAHPDRIAALSMDHVNSRQEFKPNPYV
jgi:hypothetical protein